MKLHEDSDGFTALLRIISESTGVRLDVLEKDYYVTLFLKELSEWQGTLPAYFKGGTALYKAIGSIRRFSEDIDLTVCIDGCNNSQAKSRLEKAANGYRSLPRTSSKEMESNRKGNITSVYDYRSVLGTFIPDPLQRFNHVKVEATSFTVSEPFTPLIIAPLVFEKATDDQKAILRDRYDVSPFSINTIRLERIFVDKVFASEFYYQREEYFDVSKHIYDLSVMLSLDEIQRLISDPAELAAMMAFKRREEEARIGSDLSEKPISDFTIFEGMKGNKGLQERFISMQDIYIFSDSDKMDFDRVTKSLSVIRDRLLSERP
ncbi:MAG: nucleotidyl transferase AbiEii/AbiGii toxin family protein [Methanomassiliicoccaceae archaeon]|nr:nucleotidyl transferase AbiEii/AbiGii toxin family protein [Methanomassiliicoccaceae archaeon]